MDYFFKNSHVLFLCVWILMAGYPSSGQGAEQLVSNQTLQIIDTHNHLHGGKNQNFISAAKAAVKKMDEHGVSKMIIMPPPGSPGHRGVVNMRSLLSAIRKYPNRFFIMGGGGSLNVMIQNAKDQPTVNPALKEKFRKAAIQLIKDGIIGFGELAAEHFSFSYMHPYESISPDHELFLLLADIAGKHKLPIDIHMEAIVEDIPFPTSIFLNRSNHNPNRLKENITAFERLVSHNREAKIIWAHAGWCNTGHRTTQLCRRLLKDHPNLYMSFKLSPEGKKSVGLLAPGGNAIRPEWLDLINDFPDRFIIGSDQFYGPRGSKQIGPQKNEAMMRFISFLPTKLAWKVCVIIQPIFLNYDPIEYHWETKNLRVFLVAKRPNGKKDLKPLNRLKMNRMRKIASPGLSETRINTFIKKIKEVYQQ